MTAGRTGEKGVGILASHRTSVSSQILPSLLLLHHGANHEEASTHSHSPMAFFLRES